MSGRTVLRISIVSLALIYLVAQAGDLEPPGPPGPTMKPLNELEPRVPIHEDQLPLNITASGSYYLVGNISTTGNGIVIDADNVTIDLNGFTFSGGTGHGIMGAYVKNTEIRNGVVADWEKNGIDLGGSYLSRIIDVRAVDNGWSGIVVNGDSTVLTSVAQNNRRSGIEVGDGSLVDRCTAVDNSIEADYAGIRASGGSRVVGCISNSNRLGHGIWLENGSYAIVADSVAEGNGQDGIRIDGDGCVVRNNNSNNNFGAGVMVTGVINNGAANRIDGNQVSLNFRGILVDRVDNLIIRNSAYGNGANYDILAGNIVGPLVATATGSTPWANFDY